MQISSTEAAKGAGEAARSAGLDGSGRNGSAGAAAWSCAVDRMGIRIEEGGEEDREEIYRLRHEVYARELGQHRANGEGRLSDALDAFNVYFVARVGGELSGFVSVTPPGGSGYSMDKYFGREALPFPFDDGLYEVRVLTVVKPHRGRELAAALMYAAFRWVEARGGTRIMAIGRREVLDLYLKGGMRPVGLHVRSGAVTYDVLQASVGELRAGLERLGGMIDRLERRVDWRVGVAFRKPAACFHGGAFFDAIGEDFRSMERAESIVNADVLDAWFPPAPGVLASLGERLSWLLRTSPPAGCGGLVRAIAAARGVPDNAVLPGAGSSDLIFRALGRWLDRRARVLTLDPTYGEYAHVLEQVIGCRVERVMLRRVEGYRVVPERLDEAARSGHYDWIVLVNPNSPTGGHVARERLEHLASRLPSRTRLWIDETYVEYAGEEQSLEPYAARSRNMVVCKSMSKVYALSGARVAYLCGPPHWLEEVRAWTPPWAVSLPSQLAAVRALEDPGYYRARYEETHRLREELAIGLVRLGLEVVPGVANFLLCHAPEDGPEAAEIVRRCREEGVYLRDAGTMGGGVGRRALRVAVKNREGNRRILEVLGGALRGTGEGIE